MNRRDFIAGAATGAVVAGAATYALSRQPGEAEAEAVGDAPAVARGSREWRFVTSWPKNYPGAGTGAQRLADRISNMSDGRLRLRLYAAGELVPAFEVFDAVRDGTAECGHSAPYYWINKHKSIPYFCAMPGGLTAAEQQAWLEFGGGQELWEELYGNFGLIAFPAGGTGVQMGGWFRREINSLQDFRGLKIRIPGLAAEVVNRMGATAVNMPGGEIMSALQSGVIDAAEWVGPWNDLAFGFHRVARYFYGPGFQEGNATQELMINRRAWDDLPADLQEIVKAAAAMENQRILAEYLLRNAATLPVLIDEHNVIVRNFPDDVLREMFRLSEDVVAETAKEDEISGRIHASWSKFRRDAMDYAPFSEYGYIRIRAG